MTRERLVKIFVILVGVNIVLTLVDALITRGRSAIAGTLVVAASLAILRGLRAQERRIGVPGYDARADAVRLVYGAMIVTSVLALGSASIALIVGSSLVAFGFGGYLVFDAVMFVLVRRMISGQSNA
jgi:hypothetical protein